MQAPRPLSPYWPVIRRQIMTSGLSVLHRATGAALVYSFFLLAWWLVAAAAGPGAYAVFTGFCGSIWGGLTLLAVTGVFTYHALNGVRHLVWDWGGLLDLRHAKIGGAAVLALSALITGGLWAYLIPAHYGHILAELI